MKTDITLTCIINEAGKITMTDQRGQSTSVEKSIRARYRVKDCPIYARVRVDETTGAFDPETAAAIHDGRATGRFVTAAGETVTIGRSDATDKMPYLGLISGTRPGLWDNQGTSYDGKDEDRLLICATKTLDFVCIPANNNRRFGYTDRNGNPTEPDKAVELLLKIMTEQSETKIRLTADDTQHKELPFSPEDLVQILLHKKKGKITDSLGLPVQIYNTTTKGDYPILGKLDDDRAMFWNDEGMAQGDDRTLDLKLHEETAKRR